MSASPAASITGLSRNMINRYLKAIRVSFAEQCQKESPFSGEVEVDESYFAAKETNDAGAWSIWKNHRLRYLQKKRQGVHGDCPCLQKSPHSAIVRVRYDLESIILSDG